MKRICLLLFLVALFFAVNQVYGAEWVSIGKDRMGNELFYDREVLIQRSTDIIEVWMKVIYSDAGRKERIQERVRNKATVEQYEKLAYALELQQINCVKRGFRVMAYTDYSANEEILYKFIAEHKPSEGWEPITSDSMGEIVKKIVCVLPNKKK